LGSLLEGLNRYQSQSESVFAAQFNLGNATAFTGPPGGQKQRGGQPREGAPAA
jgi:hypothetical protein